MPGVILYVKHPTSGELIPVVADADGKLKISDEDPFEIVQDTPEDLTHVPHGQKAGNGAYTPFAVNAAGKLQIEVTHLGHHTHHEDGGDDEIDLTDLSGISAELATHIADLDAHMADLWQTFRTGQYFTTQYSTGAGTTLGFTALRQLAIPFFVPRTITVDRIAVNVSSAAGAGKLIQLGIYSDGTNLYPGSLVVDGGTVAADGTGVQAATISQQLTKGLYWLSAVSDSTPGIRAFYSGQGALGLSSNWQGYGCWWYVDIGSLAMADPFPSGGLIAETNYQPAIGVRLASLD